MEVERDAMKEARFSERMLKSDRARSRRKRVKQIVYDRTMNIFKKLHRIKKRMKKEITK